MKGIMRFVSMLLVLAMMASLLVVCASAREVTPLAVRSNRSTSTSQSQRYYVGYDYDAQNQYQTKIYTYQNVTGRACAYSAYEWSLEDYVEGYNEEYGIFLYVYDEDEYEQYIDYLLSADFEYTGSKEVEIGTRYYYYKEQTEDYVRICIDEDETAVIIEACRNIYDGVETYLGYDYDAQEYYETDIQTYQTVVGSECIASAYEWSLEDYVEGYDEEYGIFLYVYDEDEYDDYIDYLKDSGFAYDGYRDVDIGTRYYYYNEDTEDYIRICIDDDETVVIIEACRNIW